MNVLYPKYVADGQHYGTTAAKPEHSLLYFQTIDFTLYVAYGLALTLCHPNLYRTIIDDLNVSEEMLEKVWSRGLQMSTVIPDVMVPTHLVQTMLPAAQTVSLDLVEAARLMGEDTRTCVINLEDLELWTRGEKAHGYDHVYACVCVHRIIVPTSTMTRSS